MSVRKPEISALTGIRWFAAFWVVWLHYAPLTKSAPLLVRSVTSYGYLAVDCFFLLSGFILAYNYEDLRPEGLGRFWVSRFARIYPDYLFAFLLAAPLVFEPTVNGLVKGAAVLSLFQAWVPQTAFAWNTPAWSVSNEAFFYATFPFVLISLRAKSRNRLYAVAIGCLAISAATRFSASFLAPAGPITKVGTLLYACPLIRWPQFLIGVASGLLFLRGVRVSVWYGTVVLGVLFAASPLLTSDVVGSIAIAGFALLIHGLAGSSGRLSSVLSLRGVKLLGQASYAMYLIQEPIAKYMGQGSWTWFFGYFAVLTVASLGVFWLIEEPCRKLLRWKSSAKSIPSGLAKARTASSAG